MPGRSANAVWPGNSIVTAYRITSLQIGCALSKVKAHLTPRPSIRRMQMALWTGDCFKSMIATGASRRMDVHPAIRVACHVACC
ncbi:CG7798 [Drosophila busckii]|uniref:CG7798 n=1 Tax=Drosophila busckii TaxID=30019 RepID=A0A0M4EW47_DROBS|nr:CG7798 [Drosophila busckii]